MSRAAQIRFLSRTARLYDPVVRTLGFSRLWDAIATQAVPGPGARCLDVCTGTARTLPATRGLRTYETRVRDGRIYVVLEAS